jgi:hypothetical protein
LVPNRVDVSIPHMKRETDSVSETLCFLVIKNPGRWSKSTNPVILRILIMFNRRYPLRQFYEHSTCIDTLFSCLKREEHRPKAMYIQPHPILHTSLTSICLLQLWTHLVHINYGLWQIQYVHYISLHIHHKVTEGEELSPGVKRLGVSLTIHLQLLSRSKIRGSLYPLAHVSSRCASLASNRGRLYSFHHK